VVSAAERYDLRRRIGRSQLDRPVRAFAVAMLDVLPQDALKLAAAAHEQPVETLLAQCGSRSSSVPSPSVPSLLGATSGQSSRH